MAPADSTLPRRKTQLDFLSPWTVPLVALFALWLWLALSAGGFTRDHWLLPGMLLGIFGIVIAALVTHLHRPRGLSLAVLVVFACYSLVVAFSVLWAESVSRVWLDSSRAFGYLLVLSLALVFLRDGSAQRAFRYLLMAGALVLLVICLVELGSGDISRLFVQRRFSFPVGYPNNAAALFLVAFWPLLWLAAGPEERAPVRGVALGLATGLLALAILTQSRVAASALSVTLFLTFLISPARLRTLLYLLVPALLMVYVFPHLNRYWLDGPEVVGGGLAVRTVALTAAIAGLIGFVLALLERWIGVSRRMKVIFGTLFLLGALGSIAWAAVTVSTDADAKGRSLSQTLREFIVREPVQPGSDGAPGPPLLSFDGREDIWRVATQEIRSAPLLGVGADNFVFRYDRLRAIPEHSPKQTHSYELQVLGETGGLGGVFAFGGILLAAGVMLWPRLVAGLQAGRRSWAQRRGHRAGADRPAVSDSGRETLGYGSSSKYGWQMALLAACAYWLAHASVDWLWRMAGVTVPVLLLLAAGLASLDIRPEGPQRRQRPWTKPDASGSIGSSEASGRQSTIFRGSLLTLSLLVFVFACFPYVSSLYQDSALALADRDSAAAAQRAVKAHWLTPGDPRPFQTQAHIHLRAAEEALLSNSPDRGQVVLDALALRLGSCEQALEREPADWSIHRAAGIAALDLYLATGYVEGWIPAFDPVAIIGSPAGVRDWSDLSTLQQIAPNAAGDWPAWSEETKADVRYYRNLSPEKLAQMALRLLHAAKDRNPLAGRIDLDLDVLATVAPATVGDAR